MPNDIDILVVNRVEYKCPENLWEQKLVLLTSGGQPRHRFLTAECVRQVNHGHAWRFGNWWHFGLFRAHSSI